MEPNYAKPEEMQVTNTVAAKIKEPGMYCFVRRNSIFVALPLCISNEQVDEGPAIISKSVCIADGHEV